MPRRQLSEAEYNAVRDGVLAHAPKGLDEASYRSWWERQGKQIFESDLLTAEYSPAPPEGSAMERIGGTVMNAARGLGDLVQVPFNPAKAAEVGEAMYQGSADQAAKSGQAFREGRYGEAAAHAVGMVPVLGTPVAQAGEQIGSGDVAGGLTNAALLMFPMGRGVAGRALETAGRAVDASKVGPVVKALGHDVVTRRFPMTARVLRRAADLKASPALPVEPVPFNPSKPAPVAPMAKQMASTADAAASRRMVEGTAQPQPPIEPQPSAPRMLAEGEAPKIASAVDMAARRLGVDLDASAFRTAFGMVRDGTPAVEAVQAAAKAIPAGVTTLGKTALSSAEQAELARLIARGTTPQSAFESLMAQRQLVAMPGAMSPAQMQAEIAARVGNRSPRR